MLLINTIYATRYKKIYTQVNPDNMIYYEKVLQVQYTAAVDGETVIILSGLINALRITQIEKEIKPMFTSDFSFNATNGQITLLNNVSMAAGESLFILYAVLITS